jgi:hypothetical protein
MRGFVVALMAGIPRWHARGQGFKSPQLHPRSDGLFAVDRPWIARPGQQIGSNRRRAGRFVATGRPTRQCWLALSRGLTGQMQSPGG